MEDGVNHTTNRDEDYIRNLRWKNHISPEFFKNNTDFHAYSMSQFSSSLNQGIDQQTSYNFFCFCNSLLHSLEFLRDVSIKVQSYHHHYHHCHRFTVKLYYCFTVIK